ncbi:isoaspartyl peptidase/L-asparaginase family protein [Salinimonas sediminis]|uniref:Isoaspartyl peptidase n=1 Tax=Salinimonas sediminis TaxID=2303538 RepID=A0A346NL59_9ALTE|nr:isoaspartyl peptidase/L-asparaginase [Salinimonas sediminis]AXR06266.1 isoaspartyl peptidase/L-asparaginase [Salinimonas sediminis]
MKKTLMGLMLATLIVCQPVVAAEVAIVIHGGAGTILKKEMSAEQEQAYTAKLKEAANTGYALLKAGKPGEYAVVAAIQVLEASPLFNAGVGAVYTYDETHELDASIMHGGALAAGAVAGVKTIKSPIAAALTVMQKSAHVMLAGSGAEAFAQEQGLAMVHNSYFDTHRRLEALQDAKARMARAGRADGGQQGNEKMGTVGAVVLDAQGNIVAGTSTGGMTAKRYGRIGDSPVIGAGTYADNHSCGVSGTGHGEFFIRYNVAADICARVKYQGVSINRAAQTVIDELKEAGGTGGVIAMDKRGNITMPFNTPGMYRASINTDGDLAIGIYRDMQKADERPAN